MRIHKLLRTAATATAEAEAEAAAAACKVHFKLFPQQTSKIANSNKIHHVTFYFSYSFSTCRRQCKLFE